MAKLYYVQRPEFRRVLALDIAASARTAIFATLCRINTLYMIARAGSGHIGSSFSAMDIVAWLHLNELRWDDADDNDSTDVYFSSKGHDAPGLYSVLIGLGLLDFDLIHSLRRLDGLPGHPDIGTPCMETNTGPLGMGISKAKGIVLAKRLLGKGGKVYVLTGDGELQEGQFWESLQSAANLQLGEITVIVDHNKIQSDTWVSSVSDLGNLEKKFEAFGWHVARCNGHDLVDFSKTLSTASTIADKPKIIIADTVKGKGVSVMESVSMNPDDWLYHYHSGAPSDDDYVTGVNELISLANELLSGVGVTALKVEEVPHPGRANMNRFQRLVGAYSRELVKQGEKNPQLVVLDADLVLDCGLIPFKERFPDRFFECGIAEQDMVSQAGGMALKGLFPVVHSFACFLSTRPNEQIYNNATEKTKIMYVGSLAGLLPGPPGHSHQSVRDISALAAIPALIMMEPCNEAEVALAFDFCANRTNQSSYLRLASIPCDIPFDLPGDYLMVLGKGVALTEGRDAVIVSYGPVMLSQAVKASRILLAQHGIGLKVVNLPWLNRIDAEWLTEVIKDYYWLFTLDNHYLSGGQGEMVASTLSQIDIPRRPNLRRFGVKTIPVCGQNQEVLRAHRLDAESLAAEIATCMQRHV